MKITLPFTPPAYNTLEENYKANLVYTLAWAWIVGVTAVIAVMTLLLPVFWWRAAITITSVDVTAFICLWLNSRGQLKAASVFFSLALWLIASGLALTAGGINAPSVVAYLPVIITSGFLLGGFSGILMAILCVLSSLFFVILEMHGILPPVQVKHTPLSLLLAYSVSGILIAFMQYLITDHINASIETIIRETDERKNAETAIKNLNESLEKKVLERTAELEKLNHDLLRFSTTLSHDLRSGIRRIKSFSDIVIRNYKRDIADASIPGDLEIIGQDAAKMDSIVTGLLEISKLGSKPLQLTPVNLNETINSAIAEMKKQWQHKAQEVEVITPFPLLNSDPILMQQIFANLLSNAFKYASKNEIIKVQVASIQKGDYYLFSVADNGVGFDMAQHDKLFKGFTRLHNDNEFEGTGLGLNSVKRFVEKLGGRIWAESVIGEGSTFYFTVPLREIA